jgi:hypothetical protein
MKKMKSPIRILKTLILLFMAVCTFAGNTNPLANISKTGSESFILNLKKSGVKKVNVRIMDNDGNTLLTQRINTKKKEAVKYNMSELPSGKYSIIVEDKQRLVKHEVVLHENTQRIDVLDAKTIYKPVFINGKQFVDLNMLQTNDSAIKVSITDTSGITVFSETIESTGSIQKRYNVSKMPAGSYTIQVVTCGERFDETFRITP